MIPFEGDHRLVCAHKGAESEIQLSDLCDSSSQRNTGRLFCFVLTDVQSWKLAWTGRSRERRERQSSASEGKKDCRTQGPWPSLGTLQPLRPELGPEGNVGSDPARFCPFGQGEKEVRKGELCGPFLTQSCRKCRGGR